MKRFVAATIAAAVLLIPSGADAAEGIFSSKVKGNGKKIIENRQSALRFEKISVSNCIYLTISDRRDGDIYVRTDENLMPYVNMEVRDGVFRAWFEHSQVVEGDLRIEVDMPYNGQIRDISISGASSVNIIPTLEAGEVELSATGASHITANIRANSTEVDLKGASVAKLNIEAVNLEFSASGASSLNILSANCRECEMDITGASKVTAMLTASNCECDASGASKISLTGSAHSAEFDISGASKLSASDFVTDICDIEASGASAAYVNCTTTLKAESSGASKIGYSGDCRVNISSDSVFKQK